MSAPKAAPSQDPLEDPKGWDDYMEIGPDWVSTSDFSIEDLPCECPSTDLESISVDEKTKVIKCRCCFLKVRAFKHVPTAQRYARENNLTYIGAIFWLPSQKGRVVENPGNRCPHDMAQYGSHVLDDMFDERLFMKNPNERRRQSV